MNRLCQKLIGCGDGYIASNTVSKPGGGDAGMLNIAAYDHESVSEVTGQHGTSSWSIESNVDEDTAVITRSDVKVQTHGFDTIKSEKASSQDIASAGDVSAAPNRNGMTEANCYDGYVIMNFKEETTASTDTTACGQ